MFYLALPIIFFIFLFNQRNQMGRLSKLNFSFVLNEVLDKNAENEDQKKAKDNRIVAQYLSDSQKPITEKAGRPIDTEENELLEGGQREGEIEVKNSIGKTTV